MKRFVVFFILLCAVFCSAHADRTVTMSFAGDITIGGEQNMQGRDDSFTAYYNQFGPDYFLANVRPLFENDDITFVNLEGPMLDVPGSENKQKTFRFRAPTSFLDVLTGSSVECVTIANNHIMDFGTVGYNATRDALKKAGVGFTINEDAYIWEKDGIRIAFMGMLSTDIRSNREKITEQIRRMKEEQGVNAVVMMFHMGMEYRNIHEQPQTNAAAWAIDAGVDLVLMHHPHVLQGMEIINNRYVFYSLGNFCFGGNRMVKTPESLYTLVVQADFTFSDEGKYLGQTIRIYPGHISGTYPESNFQPELVTGEEAQKALDFLRNDTTVELAAFDEAAGCVEQPFLPAK